LDLQRWSRFSAGPPPSLIRDDPVQNRFDHSPRAQAASGRASRGPFVCKQSADAASATLQQQRCFVYLWHRRGPSLATLAETGGKAGPAGRQGASSSSTWSRAGHVCCWSRAGHVCCWSRLLLVASAAGYVCCWSRLLLLVSAAGYVCCLSRLLFDKPFLFFREFALFFRTLNPKP
jgi:hypothetical protein